MNDLTLIDLKTGQNQTQSAVDALKKDGMVILRGLYGDEELDGLNKRFELYFDKPTVSGTVGCAQLSHAKTATSVFTLGGPIVRMLIESRLIDIVQTYMGSNCVLAEATAKRDLGVGYVYFPPHADFHAGWKKSATSEFVLTQEDMECPVGVGAALYLHDTVEGAFCYSLGSHALKAKHGLHLDGYPPDLKREIVANLVRCDGRKRDMVVFDDRGFHGPDQPSKSDRSAILLDYYREKTFGHIVVTPHPIWSSDLVDMTPEELRVLGVGADYLVPPKKTC